MPVRDGTGPLGQGSRTGRGMGNCSSSKPVAPQASDRLIITPFRWGGRIWDATFGRLFMRRRGNRRNRD